MDIMKKTHATLFAVLMVLSLAVFSCDSGSKSVATGEGGPDVSPDTVTDSNAVADNASEDLVTDTSSTGSGSDVIEPEENTVLEGSLDTDLAFEGGDTTNLDVLLPETETTADDTAEKEKLAAEQQAAEEKLAAEQQAERERLAAEEKSAAEKKAAEEKLAAEQQAEKEKLAAEQKAAEEKLAAEQKAEAERLAAEQKFAEEQKAAEEKMAAEKKAAEQKLAAEQKAEEERLAAEKKTAEEKKAAEEKLAAEQKAAEERLAAEQKAAEEKFLAEQRAAEEKFLAEQRAAEKKAAEEKLAIEQKLAAEKKAAEEKLAAEQRAIEEQLAAEQQASDEQAAADRLAAEKKAEEERLAAEKKAEEERLAAEKKAEEERLAAATTDPDEIIEEVASEEAADVAADYELDTSDGKWTKEEQGTITDDNAANSISQQIAALRQQIKNIIKQYAKNEIARQEAQIKIKRIRAQIAELRAKVGNGGNKIEGISTDFANQDLFLNIKKGQSGWYRLVVIAKNSADLPRSYDRFTFNVTNESGDILGSFDVKASDKVYNRGSIDLELNNPAGSKLNIVWTNDYYVANKYNAKLNIKKIALKKIKDKKDKKHKQAHLKGNQFAHMDGRWFFDGQTAFTHWSGQEIGYKFDNLEEGVYEVTIEAENKGNLPLPADYKEFKIDVESDYDSGEIAVEASDKASKKGTITMNFPEGSTTVYTTWTNNSYEEGKNDTNLGVKSISVKKVKESNLTAYLLKTKPGNKIFILAAFLVISGVLAGLYIKNRSVSSAS